MTLRQQPRPHNYTDALNMHLEGKWPNRKLTTLEWAVLVFMSLHVDGDITEDYHPTLTELGLEDAMYSSTYGAAITSGRYKEWCGLYPNTEDFPTSLFHVLPFDARVPQQEACFRSACKLMEGLRKLFLVERGRRDEAYGTFRLTPFGCMYIGPILRDLSEG